MWVAGEAPARGRVPAVWHRGALRGEGTELPFLLLKRRVAGPPRVWALPEGLEQPAWDPQCTDEHTEARRGEGLPTLGSIPGSLASASGCAARVPRLVTLGATQQPE